MSRDAYVRHYSTKQPNEMRRKMMAKINIEFPKLRPDLRHSTEELREERLFFCQQVLGLRVVPSSLRDLTDKQLGRVIEAIKRERTNPPLPGYASHSLRQSGHSCEAKDMTPGNETAEIIHLAGPEQVWAINRVMDHLGWSAEGRARFLKPRFNRENPALLKPKEANSLLMILLNIAASNSLKRDGKVVKVTRAMIRHHIPTLKKELGIDQGDRQ